MSQKIEIFYEATPNPNSLKFNVMVEIATETMFFDEPTKSARSPLAQKLFGFPWMKAVHISPRAITVTKQDWVDWKIIADPLSNLLTEHLERGEGVLLPADAFEIPANSSAANENDSPIVKKIKEILERDIRPAVAMDGGDIVFSRYEDHRLYLHMQGACSGCPSSAITLKQGIEARLKEEIPELLEVISI